MEGNQQPEQRWRDTQPEILVEPEQPAFSSEQRVLQLSIAVVSLLLLTPFAVNNVLQGRYWLGLGASAIVAIFAANAIAIHFYQRYYPRLLLAGLAPCIILFLVFSIRQQGIVGALWCAPAIISFYFILPERRAWLANTAIFLIVFPTILVEFELPVAARALATLTMVSAFAAIFIRIVSSLQEQLRRQAHTDPLTDVHNRTRLIALLEEAIERNKRHSVPMTLVAFDLDHFKSINDDFGHDVGDDVLVEFAALLKSRSRRVDKVFRTGGEEFLVLLYGTDGDGAAAFAEEIISKLRLQALIPQGKVTASAGIAAIEEDDLWRSWMKRADAKLYQAKAEGRDRVCR